MGHDTFERSVETRSGVEYTLRPFEAGDEAGFLDLYEAVWGDRCDAGWFDWRFRQNPHVDAVPMVVVEADGVVVGTRPFLAQEMRVGDERVRALQSVDTMVHPAHRRRGLFSWMTAAAEAYFVDREPAFAFAQPNAAARMGYRSLGWRAVGRTVTAYRVQHPTPLLRVRHGDRLSRVLGAVLRPAVGGILDVLDRLTGTGPAADIEVIDGVAATELTALYGRDVPTAIHAHRDEAYYRWRFASPAWSRSTAIAAHDDGPVAGVLYRTRETIDGVTVTQIADVVPLVGGPTWVAAVAALLRHVIERHRNAHVIASPDQLVPAPALAPAGFLRDDRLPLSRLTRADVVLLARSLAPDRGWTIAGRSLLDPANWHLSYGERDTI